MYFLTGTDPAFVPLEATAVREARPGFSGVLGLETFLNRTVMLEFQGRIQTVPGISDSSSRSGICWS